MLVLIVMMNRIDDNKNNTIFNVVFRCIIIKYHHEKEIWSLVYFSFLISLVVYPFLILPGAQLYPIA